MREPLIETLAIISVLDQPIPHTASCTLSETGHEAYFALAYQANVALYTMNCTSGQVSYIELKESYTVPRILTNLTGAFRYNFNSYFNPSSMIQI